MKHFTHPSFAFPGPLLGSLVALALALIGSTRPAAQAQVIAPSVAQGLASNMPVGLSLYATHPNDAVRIRAPGTNSGQPVAWSAASFSAATALHPDYSPGALTQWAPTSIAPPRFGGISSGGERMPPVDSSGLLDMDGFENWYALAISVDRNAHGVSGSMVEALTAGERHPAGDIFSYYVADSEAIHPNFPHTVRLEYSREQLQLSPTPEVDGVISNVDFGIGVISVDPLNRAGSMFPVRDAFYFTLTKQWIALTTGTGLLLDGAAPNAATVYAMQWSGTAWSLPEIVYTPAELLGENVDPASVEIDALSVDANSAQWLNPARVVFSLTPASNTAVGGPFDQLLVYAENVTPFAKTLQSKDPNAGPSRPVTEHLGLVRVTSMPGEPDNVTSTCGLDPLEPYQLGAVVGRATDLPYCGDGRLGFTAMRTDTPQDAPDTDKLHLQVTGLDISPYQHAFVELYVETPTAWSLWGTYWVSPHGMPPNTLDVPVAVDVKPLTATRMYARICYLDPTTLTLVPLRESWVVGFKL